MNLMIRISAIAASAIFAAGCAVTVPTEMRLEDSNNRKLVDNPGTNLDSIRLACAESMLNASPANEATNIDSRIVSQGDIVVSEVNATLNNLGGFKQSLPVTFRCEYQRGKLISTSWTRGLE